MTAELKLYIGQATRFEDADPARGRDGGVIYSGKYLIPTTSEQEAADKLRDYLNTNSMRHKNWQVEKSDVIRLDHAKDTPLETRIKILTELVPLLPEISTEKANSEKKTI